jgi:hypothetical protein
MAEKTNGQSAANSSGMTKMDGVIRALAKLGKKAKPLQIQAYVKDNFGIDISTSVVSAYKKELAKRAARGKVGSKGKGKAKGKGAKKLTAAKAPAPATTAVAATVQRSGNGKARSGISLDDIQTLKGLVQRVGERQLRALIDVLAQ